MRKSRDSVSHHRGTAREQFTDGLMHERVVGVCPSQAGRTAYIYTTFPNTCTLYAHDSNKGRSPSWLAESLNVVSTIACRSRISTTIFTLWRCLLRSSTDSSPWSNISVMMIQSLRSIAVTAFSKAMLMEKRQVSTILPISVSLLR